jgi:NitT/TauT family transport system substrate-binding protein
MKFRTVCGASVAATVAISVLVGCSTSTPGQATGPLEKTNLVVDAFPAIDSVGLFIAEQEGLFKKQGLNVKIDLAKDSQSAITGQLAGTYDITSADYVTYIDNVLNGKAPLRIVAESSVLQPNVLTLLVKGGSSVKSIGQLKNQTVSVNAPNDIGTLLIDSVLTENGVQPKTVHFNNNVQFSQVGAALESGEVAASFTPEPFVSVTEMGSGAQELTDLDQGANTDFPIQGVAVTQSWARSNPNTLTAFERAYSQGQEIADTDRSAVEKALESFLGMHPIAAALVSLPSFPTGVNATPLQRIVDAMLKFGLLDQKYKSFNISSIIGSG